MEDKAIVPSWLVKSLAWTAILSFIGWVGYVQGQVNTLNTVTTQQQLDQKDIDKAQDIKLAEDEKDFDYIKAALNRIEYKINKELN